MKQRHHGFENGIEHHLQAYTNKTIIVTITITILLLFSLLISTQADR